jgi:hypothetical protein
LAAIGSGDDEQELNEWKKLDVQVDNYLKALARGGQLYGGVSLEQALAWNWNLRIRK